MRIIVCSREGVSEADQHLASWEYVRSLGHTVWVKPPSWKINKRKLKPHAIISWGVSHMEESFIFHHRYPTVPLFCYNWDCYEWVWSNPRPGEYNFGQYGNLLYRAAKIWVPSHCTGLRTKQWWDLDQWEVIKSACPWWEHDNVHDGEYALCCLREIPDPWWGMFEMACEQIGIPYKTTRHEVTHKEYRDAVAGCRFLVAPLFELSTGGLTLMEGYYHGKPCLINDSEWNGGRDYMGDRATYFKHGDFEEFKRVLMLMQSNTPVVDVPEAREWITKNYSEERMMDDILESIERTLHGRQ